MEGDFIKINEWLTPLSWLYGLGVGFRNMLFETGILKSRAFSIPVISVGNITVGGTGKTPHVEYLIRLLQDKARVAVLSRGYKRKSKGFVVANDNTTMRDLGDEPFQMKHKYPRVTVAVDKKRVHGIEKLTELDPTLDVIVLDDAFQHRYVKPGVNILLVDYHRLIIYDKLLPAGRLREPLKGKDRADVVIVTKCPKELKPMEFRVITKAMDLFPYQKLFFTTLNYEPLVPIFPKECTGLSTLNNMHVLLLTGIASPQQLETDLSAMLKGATYYNLSYPDHHNFCRKDIDRINAEFEAMPSPKCIITTEKDAARLAEAEGMSNNVRQNLYAIPIRVSFMLNHESAFNDFILSYIQKNSKNSILAKRKGKQAPDEKPATISFK